MIPVLDTALLTTLSPREHDTLVLLATGHTNREVAAKFGCGIKTVDTHRANLLTKLRLRNNSDLTRYALKCGLLDVDVNDTVGLKTIARGAVFDAPTSSASTS